MELEKDYKRDISSESGSETAYTVEARYNYHAPTRIGTQIFDNRWRKVIFEESVIGVPPCPSYRRRIIENGLLGYSAAQALRWWLHANADASSRPCLCLETRLVSHKITYSSKVEAIAPHKLICGEDRSNTLPDWGKE